MSTKSLSLVNYPSAGANSNAEHGGTVACLAAIGWIVLGLESIVRPRQVNARDAFWILPFVFTAATFWCMHRVQRESGRRLEWVAFQAVMLASVLVLAGNLGVQLNEPMLAMLGFPWGAVVWTFGLAVYGTATWRAGVFPKYVGIGLILLEPGSILTGLALSRIAPLHQRGSYSAGVEKGAMLMLVAFGFLAIQRRQAVLK